MTDQASEVARNEWGVILHDPERRILELRWFPATRDMTDDDFKASLELYTAQAERLQPMPFMLIDATQFLHSFADPAVMTWRDETIIPRYNQVGVARFAFHVPPGTPGTIESGGAPAVEGRASFPTAWFSTREKALEWLGEIV
jgi:hypothetical protein